MSATPPPGQKDSDFWRDYLTNGSPLERQELIEVVSLHVGPPPR